MKVFKALLLFVLFWTILSCAAQAKTVLLVGDSMAEGVNPYLARKVKADGDKYCQAYKRGSRLEYWSSYRFSRAVEQCKPDVIFILLGANHLDDSSGYVRTTDVPLIASLINQSGNAEVFWIGPPSWKKSGGIEDSLARLNDNYFESRNYKWKRQPDGKHLTMSEYSRWTNLFWNWHKHDCLWMNKILLLCPKPISIDE